MACRRLPALASTARELVAPHAGRLPYHGEVGERTHHPNGGRARKVAGETGFTPLGGRQGDGRDAMSGRVSERLGMPGADERVAAVEPGGPGERGGAGERALPPGGDRAGWSRAVRALLALACIPFGSFLMNSSLFPLFDAVFPFARDIGELASSLTAALVALVAIIRPRLLRPSGYTAAALVLWAVGSAGVHLGLGQGSALLLVMGSVASKVGCSWFMVTICIACVMTLEGTWLLVGTPLAVALGCAASLALVTPGVPAWLPLAVYTVAVPVGALMVHDIARAAVADIAAAPAAREVAVTQPSSFLPPGNRVFICFFVFSVAEGFAMRFGPQEGRVASMPYGLIALLAVTAYCWLSRSRQRFDLLFSCAVLCVVAGFLVVPLPRATALATGALHVGDSCYQVLYNLVLFSIAGRNRLASLSVIGWGQAWSTTGIVVGANVGALVQANLQSDMVYLASAAVALALLAYVLFGMRGFSFGETIEGITPVEPLNVPVEPVGRSVEQACAELAAAHGLTARETDVLCLLARGRNNSYIQEELSLTRNTVKSHIKHVYQKLGVHGHQELIDLANGVEPEGEGRAAGR